MPYSEGKVEVVPSRARTGFLRHADCLLTRRNQSCRIEAGWIHRGPRTVYEERHDEVDWSELREIVRKDELVQRDSLALSRLLGRR